MTELEIYIEAIRKRFRPATEDTATHFFTTEEVVSAIQSQNPAIDGLNRDVVHDALLEAGFRLGTLKGTQSISFRWMMMEE